MLWLLATGRVSDGGWLNDERRRDRGREEEGRRKGSKRCAVWLLLTGGVSDGLGG